METQTQVTECSWTTYSWLFGDSKCTEPATRILTTGCVHEHLHNSPACDDCTRNVVNQIEAGTLFCTLCRDKGGHDGCKVALVDDVPVAS